MSGRGFGVCTGAVRYGAGLGLGLGRSLAVFCRRSYGRNFIADPTVAKTQKVLLI